MKQSDMQVIEMSDIRATSDVTLVVRVKCVLREFMNYIHNTVVT